MMHGSISMLLIRAAQDTPEVPDGAVYHLDWTVNVYYAGGSFYGLNTLMGGIDPDRIDSNGMSYVALDEYEPTVIGPLYDVASQTFVDGMTHIFEFDGDHGILGPILTFADDPDPPSSFYWHRHESWAFDDYVLATDDWDLNDQITTLDFESSHPKRIGYTFRNLGSGDFEVDVCVNGGSVTTLTGHYPGGPTSDWVQYVGFFALAGEDWQLQSTFFDQPIYVRKATGYAPVSSAELQALTAI